VDEGADAEGAASAEGDAVGFEGAVLLRVAPDLAARVEGAPVADGDKRPLRQVAPSSKTRRPIRTPRSRQITFLNGVPLKIWR